MADSLSNRRGFIIRVKDLVNFDAVVELLKFWREAKAQDIVELGQPVPTFFSDDRLLQQYAADYARCGVMALPDVLALRGTGTVIFEGAQGVLLDEDSGFHPHTTWSRTTPRNAEALINVTKTEPDFETRKIGVIRTYMTRHGAGPFVTEDPTLDYTERHNGVGEYQGAFRLGHFDLVALRYSLKVSGVTEVAVNHLDELWGQEMIKVCVAYSNMEDIPVLPPDDFDRRTALTQKLFEAKPVYEYWNAKQFLINLTSEIRLPIAYVGTGPNEHRLANSREIRGAGQAWTNSVLPV